ncbi:MAG: hypothetical protein A2Z20_08930 [Bdellovibrionales bacterium RBG_16_40_8]|nr:MAG: hypothetical protein A2Z20_08930 [Bdellovibrionales bacterium RBG_16_40_8]
MTSDKIPDWAANAAAAILQAVLKKDPFTFYHCCRVGQAARKLGIALGLPEYELALLEYSGLFHDIGKIGLPDYILLKPDRLNECEIEQMKNHAQMSVDIIRPLTKHPFFRHLIPGIRYHHERFNGQGYPMGLIGEKIPFIARALAIVDSVDAMMHARPYRLAQNWDYAKNELIVYSGTQFDPQLVEVYLDAVKKGLFDTQQSSDEVVIPTILKSA